MGEDKTNILPDEVIMSKIIIVRGSKVMMDSDLAELYGVTTGNLNKAVRRNIKRFPEDFMFSLTRKEFEDLIFQSGTSKWGGKRKLPSVFTEQGVAMLSSVLHSDRAISVNIQIIRVFTKLRKMLEMHSEILKNLADLKQNDVEHERQILLIFEYLKKLEEERVRNEEQKSRRKIGFKREG